MRGPAAREQGKSTKKKTHAVAKRGTSRVGVPRGEKGRAAEKVSAGAGFVVRGRRGPASTKATAPPARMHGGTAALKSLSRASVFARAAAAGRTTPKSLKNSTVKRPPVNRELINRPTGRAGGAAGPILPMTATGRPFFPPTLPPTSPGCPPTYDLQVFRRRAADAFERRERVLAAGTSWRPPSSPARPAPSSPPPPLTTPGPLSASSATTTRLSRPTSSTSMASTCPKRSSTSVPTCSAVSAVARHVSPASSVEARTPPPTAAADCFRLCGRSASSLMSTPSAPAPASSRSALTDPSTRH